MRRHSLTWKLILPVITASVLGILLSGYFAHSVAKREILKGVNREINLTAREMVAQVTAFFGRRTADLDSFAEVPLIQDYFNNRDFGLGEEAGAYLAGFKKFSSVFLVRTGGHLAAGLLDRDGTELCRVEKEGGAPRGAALPPFFAQAGAAGPAGRYVSGVVPAAGGPPFMVYARPVHSPAGEFRGVVYLQTDLTSLAEKLDRLKVGGGGFSFVSDENGKVVLGARRPAGVSALEAGRDIPGTGLSVSVVAEASDFLKPLAQIRAATFGFVVFFGFSAGLFIYRRIRSSLAPINALINAAGRFSKGELDYKVEAGNSIEFAALAKAFNEMAVSIKSPTNCGTAYGSSAPCRRWAGPSSRSSTWRRSAASAWKLP
ncbi:MAG: hypothetical protein COT18_02025 [Elusimicrobia bacterium CG08_land_8_20_14_0_20_59_10]|nr:MAG: hypothetical protein COT18_02025 [Elusimicrobia bacterium CG08_land_8_20_14_0_20_59_10]